MCWWSCAPLGAPQYLCSPAALCVVCVFVVSGGGLVVFLSGLGIGGDVLNAIRSATSATASPDSYFRFDDTPLFPVINRSLGSANLAAAAASGSSSSSAGAASGNAPGMVSGSRGYSWTVWLRLSRVRDNATNLFSFLAENGCGVQSFIQQNKVWHCYCAALSPAHTTDSYCVVALQIRVRCLPNASETAPCNRATLPLNRWFFLAIVHVPAVCTLPQRSLFSRVVC